VKSKLPSKQVIGIVTIAAVGLVTWLLGSMIGSAILGNEGWGDWRDDHIGLFLLIWLATVMVIVLPLLWMIGTRMAAAYAREEEEIAAARGVGKLAGQALRGSKGAKQRLVDLLDEDTVQIRCQACRALVLLSEDWTDHEIERRVRYWPGNDKLALIENLKSSGDMRATWVLEMFAEDRNPIIARRAQDALVHVMPRTRRMDGELRKAKEKQDRRAAKAGSASAAPRAEVAGGDGPARPPAERMDKREPPPRRERRPAPASAGSGPARSRRPGAAPGRRAPASAAKAAETTARPRPAKSAAAAAADPPANTAAAAVPEQLAKPSDATSPELPAAD